LHLLFTAPCGQNFTNQETGVLQSPGYPQHYLNNLNCMWVITAGVNDVIRINLNSNVNLDCPRDNIGIFNSSNHLVYE